MIRHRDGMKWTARGRGLSAGFCQYGGGRRRLVSLGTIISWTVGFLLVECWLGWGDICSAQSEPGSTPAPSLAETGGGEFTGKPALRIGRIDIAVTDIYSDAETDAATGFIRFMRRSMNALHFDTRQFVIQRELLFRTGDPLTSELLVETERNLRSLGFFRQVQVVAVDTLADGSVPIVVRAQETWSLQTQMSYSQASNQSRRWSILLSDVNFLGYGIQVGLGLGENEDYHYTHFVFGQRRLFGSHWSLEYRKTDPGDGYSESVALARPFFAQDDGFGLEAVTWREQFDRRYYLSNAGPAGVDPTDISSLYTQIPVTSAGFRCEALFRISPRGSGRIWRLGPGLELLDQDFQLVDPESELSDGRWVNPRFLTDGETPLTRERGLGVYPLLCLESRGRTWTKARFTLKYGPVEDIPLDPRWDLRLSASGKWSGSTMPGDYRYLLANEFSDWSRLGPGFLLMQGKSQVVFGAPEINNSSHDLLCGWFGHHRGNGSGPRLFAQRTSRLFVEAAWGDEMLGTRAFTLGLIRGLRTLGFNGMAGDRLYRWNAEHGIVLPQELMGLMRLGVAGFYAGGLAWWQGEQVTNEDIRHELGFGLRVGPSRTGNADVARLDLTWALDESGGPTLTAVTRGLF